MAASLDDILTTQKNGVVAINNLDQDVKSIVSAITTNSTDLSSIAASLAILADHSFPEQHSVTVLAGNTTLVYTGAADIYAVSIVNHSGANRVKVYDSATTGGISGANLIWASLPANSATFTNYNQVTIPVTNGIVIVTDTGMDACVVYSPDP